MTSLGVRLNGLAFRLERPYLTGNASRAALDDLVEKSSGLSAFAE